MFYGYCLSSHGWTPRVELATPAEAYRYCLVLHRLFPEVRITDAEDYCVMHVVDHVLKVPWTDGSLKEFSLNSPTTLA